MRLTGNREETLREQIRLERVQAELQKSLTVCEKEDNPEGCRSQKIVQIAQKVGIAQICDQLSDDGFKNCVRTVAIEGKNPKACEILSESKDQQFCQDAVYWLLAMQNNDLATYANKIEKEEAKIHWQHSAEAIARQIRAFNPWPVAHTTLGDKIIKIWEAQALASITHADPGMILHADKRGIDVATGKGILRLLTLQLPGHKAMSVVDMLNGHAALFAPGTAFNE